MRLIHLILINLLIVLALLIWIALAPEPSFATGGPHSRIAGMGMGGDGLVRTANIATAAYWLQAAVMVLVVLLLASSINPAKRTVVFWLPVLGVAAIYQFVWWQIWSGHQRFLLTGDVDFFMGFATPTAWMVIGIWLSGLGWLLIYVLGFRRFIFSEADEAVYRELLEDSGSDHPDAGRHP